MATIMQNGGPEPSTAMQRETMEKVMARLEREFPDRKLPLPTCIFEI
jgi:hypothetical protein